MFSILLVEFLEFEMLLQPSFVSPMLFVPHNPSIIPHVVGKMPNCFTSLW